MRFNGSDKNSHPRHSAIGGDIGDYGGGGRKRKEQRASQTKAHLSLDDQVCSRKDGTSVSLESNPRGVSGSKNPHFEEMKAL